MARSHHSDGPRVNGPPMSDGGRAGLSGAAELGAAASASLRAYSSGAVRPSRAAMIAHPKI